MRQFDSDPKVVSGQVGRKEPERILPHESSKNRHHHQKPQSQSPKHYSNPTCGPFMWHVCSHGKREYWQGRSRGLDWKKSKGGL